jgi:hypothetical protein
MNDSHSKEIGQFLIFCLEEYKAAESLSGESAFGLFEKNGVFDYLKEGYDQLHTLGSAVLLRELAADPDSQRRELHFRVLKRHHVVILPMDSDDEVARLANAYLREGVMPERKRDDALREVWEWKDAVSRDMAELTTAEALRRIHAEAEGIGREYGLSRAMPYGKRLCVAEDRADYGRKNDEESTKA